MVGVAAHTSCKARTIYFTSKRWYQQNCTAHAIFVNEQEVVAPAGSSLRIATEPCSPNDAVNLIHIYVQSQLASWCAACAAHAVSFRAGGSGTDRTVLHTATTATISPPEPVT
jgi:hypothetical protein